MKLPRTLLSDADGTLVNTLPLIRHGLYETSRTYFELAGIPAEDIPSYEAYEAYANQAVGASARHTIDKAARLLYEHQPHHLDILDFDALHELLDPIQDRLAPDYVSAYPGLFDTLHSLGGNGIKLAIFTSSSAHHIVRNFGVALPELGLSLLHADKTKTETDKLRAFETTVEQVFGLSGFTVVCAEDVTAHKPDPESLNLAMRRLKASPSESAVLGDHSVDMQSGINGKVLTRIGITHGFNDRKSLLAAGATTVIDSLIELPALLAK
ncbi:hypothetical protein BH23PAT1_BH23PAT1_3010 [soil metagenome]